MKCLVLNNMGYTCNVSVRELVYILIMLSKKSQNYKCNSCNVNCINWLKKINLDIIAKNNSMISNDFYTLGII